MTNLARGLAPAVAMACAFGVTGEAKAVVAFNICGITDNGVGDTNPILGVIAFNCVTGTGTLSGTAQETNLTNYHRMVITNARATGTGTEIISASYTLGNWMGMGSNRAWTIGESVGQTGGGYSDANSHASTFGGPDAYALAILPVPAGAFSAITTTRGLFSGPGLHTGTFTWNATAGAILWPDSNEFILAVPEPASWAMMISGFGLAGIALRRRRRLPA